MTDRKPSIYIPTLYFAEGLPYTIVKMMSVPFFVNFGATNDFVALATNLLTIPWTIKPLWSSLVDIYSTKRIWILTTQLVLAVAIAALAGAALSPARMAISVVVFACIALASATHDIAIDGYYLDVLKKDQQAFYVGVRNTAYKLAWLFGSGWMVYLAGEFGERFGIASGWEYAFLICAAIMAAAFMFHSRYLPEPTPDAAGKSESRLTFKIFIKSFSSYFAQPGIVAIVLYILTFRMGDALMLTMTQPFLLAPLEKGGLHITTKELGIIYGAVGTTALLAGGIVGGWLVAKDGLKRWLWPTALIQNSAILLYWLLAVMKPGLIWVAAVNAVEQFSYGLGVAAYTVFLLRTVKAEFKAAHYAIATGMMALGLLVPGALSGYLEMSLGYANFFLVSFLCAIPGIITIFFLPLEETADQTSG